MIIMKYWGISTSKESIKKNWPPRPANLSRSFSKLTILTLVNRILLLFLREKIGLFTTTSSETTNTVGS
jgi:hypothetical protein